MYSESYLVELALLGYLSSSLLQVVRKAEIWFSPEFFPSGEVSSIISALALLTFFCLFSVGLSVLPTQLLISLLEVLGSFSSLEALVNVFLPTWVFLSFQKGFGLDFLFVEALFLADRPCTSNIV